MMNFRMKRVKKKAGLLISIEGLSSSGKSLHLRKFAERLQNVKGNEITVVSWNSIKVIRGVIFTMHKIRLLNPTIYCVLQWKACLLIYIFKIYPNLRKGKIVIADRYIHTAFARDIMNGVKKEFTYFLYRFFKKPDCIIYFDVPPKICVKNMRKGGGKKLFHLCHRIKKAKSIVDKDLHYLVEFSDCYLDVFGKENLLENRYFVNIGKQRLPTDLPTFDGKIPMESISEMRQNVNLYIEKHE